MSTVTKIRIKEYVKEQLSTNPTWVTKALIQIYGFQTSEEKVTGHLRVFNNVGFTGSDSELLTSFAKQLQMKGSLSAKQMALLYRKMPKYWKQIIGISDPNKLEALVVKSLNQ